MGKPTKTPLRKVQIRILKAMYHADVPGAAITIAEIAKAAKVSVAMVRFGMGPADPKLRDAHDTTQGYKCLLSRGFVKCYEGDMGSVVHYLTPLGSKKLQDVIDNGEFTLSAPNKNQHGK